MWKLWRRVHRAPSTFLLPLVFAYSSQPDFVLIVRSKDPSTLVARHRHLSARPTVIYACAFRFRGCILCQVTRVDTNYVRIHTHIEEEMYTSLRRLHNACDRYCVSPYFLRAHNECKVMYPLLSAILYTGCLIEMPMIPRVKKKEMHVKWVLFSSAFCFWENTFLCENTFLVDFYSVIMEFFFFLFENNGSELGIFVGFWLSVNRR